MTIAVRSKGGSGGSSASAAGSAVLTAAGALGVPWGVVAGAGSFAAASRSSACLASPSRSSSACPPAPCFATRACSVCSSRCAALVARSKAAINVSYSRKKKRNKEMVYHQLVLDLI